MVDVELYMTINPERVHRTTSREFTSRETVVPREEYRQWVQEGTIAVASGPDKSQKVAQALDAYDAYTQTLDEQSNKRLQGIVEGLQKQKENPKDDPKLGSMKGPGVYHARWQWLLDETLITPSNPSGPSRHGKDVKDVKARGKTGALASKDAWDASSLPQVKSDATPEPPNVDIVVAALGSHFKNIVAEISSQRS